MLKPDDHNRSSVAVAPCYRDPKAAVRWLENAFGFEPFMMISDKEGNLMHAEMRWGDGIIMVGSEWTEDHKSPASLSGKTTVSIHVHLEDGIDAHCERARKAGARIDHEPETQFYGDRTYRARDLEGHIWTFGQTVEVMTRTEWDKAIGSVTTDRLPE